MEDVKPPDQHDLETLENCSWRTLCYLEENRFGPLVEDDEEDEEAPFEEELSHEKLAAPPGLEWRTITPKRKKNAKMVEVNTVTNEKGEDLWITVDSGASENVISVWMALAVQGEAIHWQSERRPVRCRKREHDAEQG